MTINSVANALYGFRVQSGSAIIKPPALDIESQNASEARTRAPHVANYQRGARDARLQPGGIFAKPDIVDAVHPRKSRCWGLRPWIDII